MAMGMMVLREWVVQDAVVAHRSNKRRYSLMGSFFPKSELLNIVEREVVRGVMKLGLAIFHHV